MDKKSKIITYVVIGIILILLIAIAIITRISSSAPGITAYSESGTTANAILCGYEWHSFLKTSVTDAMNVLEADYTNDNILLVKPNEKITLRNSGKDFDNYKFYQDEIKFYNDNNEETILTEEDAQINTESKFVSFEAPSEDGTYIYDIKINYHRYGNAEYGLKVVVSSIPSYNVENLTKYRNTYIGDATKVSQILNALPYKENKDGIVLRTSNKPYELIVYYKSLDVDKETLLNNTVAIFALVDNVDIVTYELDSKSFVYTRKELETVLGRDLLEYARNTELWKKEVFYNVKDTTNTDNLKIYRTLLSDVISKIKSDYIVIDLDSFNKIQISDVEKRNILKEFMKDGKIISEASNAEIRQRDTFKGILIYAESIEATDEGYLITLIKYDTEKKQETLKYEVLRDGTIIQ